MHDLAGETYFVTGSSAGLGHATARALARRGGRVWMACRPTPQARATCDALRNETGARVDLVDLDLADLASVRACATTFLASGEGLDVLINNAGIAHQGGGTTKQGFELHFGVNYLGHFLLTNLLLDRLVRSPRGRVVNVSSKAHYEVDRMDWEIVRGRTRSPTTRQEYCVSKLCNILHAKELARRFASTNLRTYALHPGVVASNIWRGKPAVLRWIRTRFMLSTEEGARTTLHCATSSEAAKETGLYYDSSRPKPPNPLADDPDLARSLWERSEEWTRNDQT
jgi:retinol dehydrogenase 12